MKTLRRKRRGEGRRLAAKDTKAFQAAFTEVVQAEAKAAEDGGYDIFALSRLVDESNRERMEGKRK